MSNYIYYNIDYCQQIIELTFKVVMEISGRLVPIVVTLDGTISRREYLMININRADIWYNIFIEVYCYKSRSTIDRLRISPHILRIILQIICLNLLRFSILLSIY